MIGQLAITYLPAMNRVFATAPISAAAWLRILVIGAAVSAVVAIDKLLRRTLSGERRPAPGAAAFDHGEGGARVG